jgi:type III pantothenate kinase
VAALLTLDRGNSTLDCMLHPGGARARLDPADAAQFERFLAGSKPDRCIAASVVPQGLAAPAAVLARAGVPLQVAGVDLPCPLRLDYETPDTLGVDRWLGALAAWREFGAAVVVDCGTATTVSLVDGEGVFRGGAIAPGPSAIAAGMAARLPHLPPAEPLRGGAFPARSTQAAVDTGALLAFCGVVERLVADALAARPGARVVLTGGHATLYLRAGRLRPLHVEDLVHQGLRLLAGPPWNS